MAQQLSDLERVDLADWWIEPLLQGKRSPMTQADLVERFAKRHGRNIDPTTAGQGVSDAFQNGLVKLMKEELVPDCWRNEDLERALTRRWNLKSAIVVETSSDVVDSNTVHRQLGLILAKAMESTPLYFRDGDITGIGSGRAVHNLITSLNNLAKIDISGITLMSLTGTVYPEATIAQPGELLDADLITVLFAKCFSKPIQVRTISFPIAHDDVSIVRRNTWLHDPDHPDDMKTGARKLDGHTSTEYRTNEFNHHIPTHAFVGVGVLFEEHRLYREVQHGRGSTMLKPIRRQLEEIVDISSNITKKFPNYHPVADICHRLFVLNPPDKFGNLSAEMARLEELVEYVNCRTLTITKTQLSKIPNVVLIAGTDRKALVIQRLLERREFNFRVICTDTAAARQLLS